MSVSPLLQAAGVRTKVGTWALSEAEAAMIELSADRDEKWEASLAGKEQWLHKPLQPPGLLRSGAWHPLSPPQRPSAKQVAPGIAQLVNCRSKIADARLACSPVSNIMISACAPSHSSVPGGTTSTTSNMSAC